MEDGVEAVYVKKSILPNGGILFCELGICEPFVYMKLYALEASRFQNDLLKARTGAMTSNSTTRSGTLNRYWDPMDKQQKFLMFYKKFCKKSCGTLFAFNANRFRYFQITSHLQCSQMWKK